MTAVEWLADKVTDMIHESNHIELVSLLEQAIQIDKDNTISFGYRCIGEVDSELGDLVYKKVPEEVYNETYGNARPELRHKDGTPMRKYNSPKLQAIEMENKQTAVEWLFERINLFCMFTDGIPDEWSEALEQAKKMEEEQMENLRPQIISNCVIKEIADKEIDKIAKEYVLYNESKRNWVVEGMKLYREHLK